jgi:CRP-like cAMP-binding protein
MAFEPLASVSAGSRFSGADNRGNDYSAPERISMNDLKQRVVNHPFFGGMKSSHLAVLAECAKEAVFATDEILFREGDPANQFYLIESGRIIVETHEPANPTITVQELGGGEVLGWSWLFPPFAWHFQAHAAEPTKVIALNGGRLLNTAERDHDFGYELMKRVAQVVIHRLQTSRKQLLELQIDSVLNG